MTTSRIKSIIRQSCRQVRTGLSSEYKIRASKKICRRIQNLECYRYAKRIALYKAVNGEVDLNMLWQTAPLQGKYCYFPALNKDKTLSFLPATPATSFEKNKHNIEEPSIDPKEAFPPDDLDILFLPLLAFDAFGTRLGMGQGYYDRTLCNVHHPLLIGVAYDFQHQAYIEPSSWDVGLQAIVTPTKIYWSHT